MSDFDISQYLSLFLEEAEEQLQALDEGLIMLEQDRQNRELLNRIFRAAHTLKGSSASMGFDKIATLTHNMENVLDRFRNGDLEVTQEVVDVLLQCLDMLRALKMEIVEEKDEVDISELIDKLQALQKYPRGVKGETIDNAGTGTAAKESSAAAEAEKAPLEMDEVFLNETEKKVLRSALEQGYRSYHIVVDLDPDCLMKSVRAYIIFNNLENLGEVIKTIPSTEDIEEEKFDFRFEMMFITKEGQDKIKNVIKSINEVQNVMIREYAGAEDLHEDRSKKLQDDKDKRDKVLTAASKPAAGAVLKKESDPERKSVSQTVRVDVSRLDNLMNLVGELVIERTRLEAVGDGIKASLGAGDLTDSLEEISVHIARLSSELQEEIMQARMFPIEQVFNRFPRMVRDLARKFNKEINFIVEGRETELDRTVIEEIGDPLIHLLRNAIDHGIEFPEERKRLGKPEKGTLRLNAFHQENQIVITVEDDGRGIDIDKIKQKGIEKGIVTPETAAKMSEQEALNLIFTPGFSTAESVSDVSGRGVGMDIVKSHIEKINGIIAISTQKGKGTKFTIKLPLTLAINRALLIKHKGRVFAFPLSNVVEIIEVESDEVQFMQRQRVTLVRDSFLPLFNLGSLLYQNHSQELEEKEKLPVVVAGISEKRIGIVVDELVGEQEIVIKSLGNYIGDIPGLAGATIMGDGSVALILDVRGLISEAGVEK